MVNKTENKTDRLVHILKRVNGSGLIYVRNRKQTQDLAQLLVKNKISADYYHAGLPNNVREHKQNLWIKNQTRIMVCTNAFGMGVNKPNCRIVVHYEMPESIESYYQEAGRAGRDQQKAYCVLLHHTADEITAIQKIESAFPSEIELRKTYDALCNYLQVPLGLNPEQSFDFEIAAFCQKYNLQANGVYHALKILNQCDLIQLNETFFEPSKFKFIIGHEKLYKYQVEHEEADILIKIILRSYGGVFDYYVNINEVDLAKKSGIGLTQLQKFLTFLHQQGLANYQPQKDKPQLTFLTNRQAPEQINFKAALLKIRKQKAVEKIDAMIKYAQNNEMCRSRQLVTYFGEFEAMNCGICDICLENKKQDLTDEFVKINTEKIKLLLHQQPLNQRELKANLGIEQSDAINHLIRYLLDNGILSFNHIHQLTWNSKEI